MNALISNKIYLCVLLTITANAIKNTLTLPNPTYQVMLRKNKRACYGLKKDFKYYEEVCGELIIGRGNLQRLESYCLANSIKLDAKHNTVSGELYDEFVSENLKLRDYQEGVPEQILKERNGVIKLSTGFGKTIIALKLIELTRLPTLIIVPQEDILDQFVQELKKYYGYDAGVIQGSTWDIQQITIASISTLQQRDLVDIRKQFGMVIVDECHKMITDARMKVIQEFNPKRLYGMSGTPDRSDGQGQAIFFTFGEILVDKKVDTVQPVVEIVNSNCPIAAQEYHDMVAEMCRSEDRNIVIMNKIVDEVRQFRKILVLTKRVEHYKTIMEYLGSHSTFKMFSVDSDMKKKDRQELLRGLRANEKEFDVIFGTYALLGTGVDVPALDTLIIAGDLKSEVLTGQSSGRILRLFEGKPTPKVIDIVDNLNGVFKRQAANRKKFYKEAGWEIK